jgi:hypothetical protein
MRSRIRRLRLYYKSLDLLTRAFRDRLKVLVFPFSGSGKFVSRSNGAVVQVPRELWSMLPTAARCVLMGTSPEWREDGLHVKSDSVEIVGPADAKEIATFFREVFVDDVYHLGRFNLQDREVIDVGAFIGDTAVAFALRGARVHAFEPVSEFQAYIAKNARINGVADRITVHCVGLSDQDRVLPICSPSHQTVTLVNASRYFTQAGISNVYLLKMDCEGCEYDLISSEEFWSALRPHHILMEFHRGGTVLAETLSRRGYEVQPYDANESVGYLFAHRVTRPASS